MRLLLFIYLIFSYLSQARGYDITLEQPINFGTVVVVNNDSSGQLSVDRFGNTTVSNNFRVITRAEPAVFSITGLPPYSAASVVITDVNEQMNPGRPYSETFTFTVTSFDPTARADAIGNSQIRVGGTITLSGSGNNVFEDASYQSSFRVSIDL